MSPFDHPVATGFLALGFLGLCVIVAVLVGFLREAPTNAAPAPEVEPVQGRAVTLCSVQWCPTSDAQNSWKGFPLCEVHFADLMNAHVLVVRDVTGDVLADEATAYLRRTGGAA